GKSGFIRGAGYYKMAPAAQTRRPVYTLRTPRVARPPHRRYNAVLVEIVWKILATLGLVALNGYFVAAEFAAVSARASRLETAAQNSLLARLAWEVKRKLDLYLSTCQLGITIASLALGAVIEPLVAAMLDPVLIKFGLAQ